VGAAEMLFRWSEQESAPRPSFCLAPHRALMMWEPLNPDAVGLVTGASVVFGVAGVKLAAEMGRTL
jgi:hypothetical protein